MATKRSSAKSARTSPKSAGKPVDSAAPLARAAGRTPSQVDLDLRDRLKAGPRRQAGPPLVGDTLTRAAMDALRKEVVPEPTEPKKPKARR